MGSQEVLPFTLSSSFWDQYLRYRPRYPSSLFNGWLEFHRGALDVVHDVGTGCGVGASCLLNAVKTRGQSIKHMILSDPTATNLSIAAKTLMPTGQSRTTFVFQQAKGEEGFLEPETIDIVTACESMHWTDAPAALNNIYTCLRPGGTFAAVFYHIYPTIRNNARAERAFRRVTEEHYVRCASKDLLDENWRKGHLQASTGLDFIRLDPDEWEDVRRIYINIKHYGNIWPWPHTVELLGPKPVSGVNSTSGNESQEFVENWNDWQIEKCTAQWLKESMISLHSSYDEQTFISDAWKDLEAATTESGGFLHITFPVTVLLARKRSS